MAKTDHKHWNMAKQIINTGIWLKQIINTGIWLKQIINAGIWKFP